jgi:hypothetical protein
MDLLRHGEWVAVPEGVDEIPARRSRRRRAEIARAERGAAIGT